MMYATAIGSDRKWTPASLYRSWPGNRVSFLVDTGSGVWILAARVPGQNETHRDPGKSSNKVELYSGRDGG